MIDADKVQLRTNPVPAGHGDAKADLDAIRKWTADEIKELKTLLSGGIRWQNLRSKLLTGTTPSSPQSPFVLVHDLGKLPEFFLPNLWLEGGMWATTEDRAAWTTSTLTLRSSVANASFTLLVM